MAAALVSPPFMASLPSHRKARSRTSRAGSGGRWFCDRNCSRSLTGCSGGRPFQCSGWPHRKQSASSVQNHGLGSPPSYNARWLASVNLTHFNSSELRFFLSRLPENRSPKIVGTSSFMRGFGSKIAAMCRLVVALRGRPLRIAETRGRGSQTSRYRLITSARTVSSSSPASARCRTSVSHSLSGISSSSIARTQRRTCERRGGTGGAIPLAARRPSPRLSRYSKRAASPQGKSKIFRWIAHEEDKKNPRAAPSVPDRDAPPESCLPLAPKSSCPGRDRQKQSFLLRPPKPFAHK